MSRAAVFLAEGYEEVEAVTPIDFLRRAGVDVVIVGVGSIEPQSARGVIIRADVEIKELHGTLDAVIIPGGMPGATHLSESAELKNICEIVMENGGLVASLCAAPAVVLGAFGLLKGRRFTCYPGFEKDIRDAEFSENSVVIDDNLITSRGPGYAGEFSLAIVRYMAGDAVADRIGKGTLIYS